MSIETLILKLKELRINVRFDKGQLKIDAPKGTLHSQLLDELKENKDELIEFLNNKLSSKIYKEITKAKNKVHYALSSAQKRLYLLQQMNIEATTYNIPYIVRCGFR